MQEQRPVPLRPDTTLPAGWDLVVKAVESSRFQGTS